MCPLHQTGSLEIDKIIVLIAQRQRRHVGSGECNLIPLKILMN
jgi:hypothetical protein